MEKPRNIFPEIDLFPRLTRVGHFIGEVLKPFHCEPFPAMSNHYKNEESYDPLATPIEQTTSWPDQPVQGTCGWDDMGSYLEKE
jgi:hypothetical protein